ncbi:hypothetical protein ACFSM5_15930 [Lacibacterium aquatile]|uniref:Uncharacterized protein n=1 Tax=Lacibacterium aquatile TaxID=1168082 RepID=A0ABW5DU20_9PROT
MPAGITPGIGWRRCWAAGEPDLGLTADEIMDLQQEGAVVEIIHATILERSYRAWLPPTPGSGETADFKVNSSSRTDAETQLALERQRRADLG